MNWTPTVEGLQTSKLLPFFFFFVWDENFTVLHLSTRTVILLLSRVLILILNSFQGCWAPTKCSFEVDDPLEARTWEIVFLAALTWFCIF